MNQLKTWQAALLAIVAVAIAAAIIWRSSGIGQPPPPIPAPMGTPGAANPMVPPAGTRSAPPAGGMQTR